MNIDKMKIGLDSFTKEMFYGFSTFAMASSDDKKMQTVISSLKGFDSALKGGNVKTPFMEMLAKYMLDHLTGVLKDEQIPLFYDMIIISRSFGLIIHNNDSIASLKMEKQVTEELLNQAQKETDLLKEEIINLRHEAISKQSKLEAVQ